MLHGWYFVLALASQLAFGSESGPNRYIIAQSLTRSDANKYLCSRVLEAASLEAITFGSDGTPTVRPLRDWLPSYQGSESSLDQLMNSLPMLLTLSDDRDEGGHAKIRIKEGDPKESGYYDFAKAIAYSFEGAAEFEPEAMKAEAQAMMAQLRALVRYVNDFSRSPMLGHNMQTLHTMGRILQINASGKDKEAQEIRFARTFQVRYNLLQALDILEQFELWCLRELGDRQHFHTGVFGDQTVMNIAGSVIESLGGQLRGRESQLLYTRLVPRTKRLARAALRFPVSDQSAVEFRRYITSVLHPTVSHVFDYMPDSTVLRELFTVLPEPNVLLQIVSRAKVADGSDGARRPLQALMDIDRMCGNHFPHPKDDATWIIGIRRVLAEFRIN